MHGLHVSGRVQNFWETTKALISMIVPIVSLKAIMKLDAEC